MGDDPGDDRVGGVALDRTRSAPVPFRVPAKTSSPGPFGTGRGSPVMVAWSTSLAPSRTRPSAPTRSPGRTRMTSPTARPVGGDGLLARTVVQAGGWPWRAPGRGGRVRESSVRAVASASSAPEVAKMTMSSAPSITCPIAAAPSAATIISRSTSRVLLAQRPEPGQGGLPASGDVGGGIQRPPQPGGAAGQLQRQRKQEQRQRRRRPSALRARARRRVRRCGAGSRHERAVRAVGSGGRQWRDSPSQTGERHALHHTGMNEQLIHDVRARAS